jgi:hypothetical protein
MYPHHKPLISQKEAYHQHLALSTSKNRKTKERGKSQHSGTRKMTRSKVIENAISAMYGAISKFRDTPTHQLFRETLEQEYPDLQHIRLIYTLNRHGLGYTCVDPVCCGTSIEITSLEPERCWCDYGGLSQGKHLITCDKYHLRSKPISMF